MRRAPASAAGTPTAIPPTTKKDLSKYHADDVEPGGAQRDVHSNLVRAPRHSVGHQAVQPNAGEYKSEDAKETGEFRQKAHRDHGLFDQRCLGHDLPCLESAAGRYLPPQRFRESGGID